MASVTLEPCSPEQARLIGARLRAADYAELEALHGRAAADVPDHLARAVAQHGGLRVMSGEVALGIGGRTWTDLPGVCGVWLLCTDAMARPDLAVAAVKAMRTQVQEWAQEAALMNACDGENRLHVKFIRMLGFEIAPPTHERARLFWMPQRELTHV